MQTTTEHPGSEHASFIITFQSNGIQLLYLRMHVVKDHEMTSLDAFFRCFSL